MFQITELIKECLIIFYLDLAIWAFVIYFLIIPVYTFNLSRDSYYYLLYSQTSLQGPPLGPKNSERCTFVVAL